MSADVADDEADGKRGQQRARRVGIEAPDDQSFEEQAERPDDERGHKNPQQHAPKPRVAQEGGYGSKEHELALTQVEDPHHPDDHGHAEYEQDED